MSISLSLIGFRFLPPDEEIISFFLKNKMLGYHDCTQNIKEVELRKHEPWELPAFAMVTSTYPEWFFFYKLNKISERKNERLTKDGFWKSTGADRGISCEGRVIGYKKTLVFYKGRTPHGVKTEWIMHEFRAAANFIPDNADNSYVVGYLRYNGTANVENSISNHGQPSTLFSASTSQNNAVGATSMEAGPQRQSISMDYELALQTHMEDRGIFDHDLSPSNGLLDLPSSSAITNTDQIIIEEAGISLADLEFLTDDSVDEERNEWQRHLDTDTIEEEKDFMASLWHKQDERRYVGARQPLFPDIGAPDYAGDSSDNAWFASDGTGYGYSEGFNQKRMENGVHHDDILIMDYSDESATVTAYETKLVKEERSVTSRTSKSRYEPRSHKSVVEGHLRRVQLEGESLGKAVSGDKTRKSGIRGPVVELVPSKKSIMQPNKDRKMDQDRNSKSGLISRSNGSAGSNRKNSFNFVEMSQLSCKPNPPLVYVVNVLLGVILFMVVAREVLFLR